MKFSGIVKKGAGRGKDLGFPTANIDGPEGIEDGIYLGWAMPGLAHALPALIFIGKAETFQETERKAEIYILDFKGNLSEKEINVELIKKIRENIKFISKEDLINQMREDEKVAREFFRQQNNPFPPHQT